MSIEMSEDMSIDMSEGMSEKNVRRYVRSECQKICQNKSQKICQKKCQKICQKILVNVGVAVTNIYSAEASLLSRSETNLHPTSPSASLVFRVRRVGFPFRSAPVFLCAGGEMAEWDGGDGSPQVDGLVFPTDSPFEGFGVSGFDRALVAENLRELEARFQEAEENEGTTPDQEAFGPRSFGEPEVPTVQKFTERERREHQRIIFEQSVAMSSRDLPKLPWEVGVFAEIFGDGSNPMSVDNNFWTPLPAEAIPEPQVAPQEVDALRTTRAFSKGLDVPVFARHIRHLCDRDYVADLDVKWTKALASWMGILEGCQFDALIGEYVLEKVAGGDRQGGLIIIRDACGIRSPTTVLKRAQDLLQFIGWTEGAGRHWWPLKEKVLLDYLTNVESTRGSKFIGKNLMHSLRFFKFLFGANFEVDTVIGPLFQGRVSRVLATRNPTEQARNLTVDEVSRLETKLQTEGNLYDRYFLGCLLFALYARARWGDLASMHSLEFDFVETSEGPYGFVEGRTRIHKTSNSVERKAKYMPYVAPIQGVTEKPWALAWKAVLEELGQLPGGTPFGPSVVQSPWKVTSQNEHSQVKKLGRCSVTTWKSVGHLMRPPRIL